MIILPSKVRSSGKKLLRGGVCDDAGFEEFFSKMLAIYQRGPREAANRCAPVEEGDSGDQQFVLGGGIIQTGLVRAGRAETCTRAGVA
jgi:hypothetical protein